jgi:glyoxylase I family protein
MTNGSASGRHPAPGGVHHVAIGVRDLGAVEAFYTGVLGLPILRRWPMAGNMTGTMTGDQPDRSVWCDLGGGAFLALERAADGEVGPGGEAADRGHGYLMIALRITCATRADWEARLAAAGVAIVHRTAYTLYVADPEGNRVGLSHWPDAAIEPGSQARG